MTDLTLHGKVLSGRGYASSHLSEDLSEIQQKTGQQIIPGSLNLVLRSPIRFSDKTAISFHNQERFLWPARINGEQVFLYRWSDAPLHVVEILANHHLRSRHEWSDNDTVRLDINPKHVGRLNALGKLTWILVWMWRKPWAYTKDGYYKRNLEFGRTFGATQATGDGDWPTLFKHLISQRGLTSVARKLVKKLIKSLPIIGPAAIRAKRLMSNCNGARDTGVPAFHRQAASAAETGNSMTLRQVKNLLDYTKTSGTQYSAAHFDAGYHSLELLGHHFAGQRNPTERYNLIPLDFRRKTVLDIGCNQGGMLHWIADQLEWGVGIDYDHRMVNAATRIASITGSTNLNFYVLDLENENLELIRDFLPGEKVDIVLLLSVCMWLKNWKSVVVTAANLSNEMIFESNGTREQQAEQESHLREIYASVRQLTESSEDDPGQRNRKMFHCSNQIIPNQAQDRIH